MKVRDLVIGQSYTTGDMSLVHSFGDTGVELRSKFGDQIMMTHRLKPEHNEPAILIYVGKRKIEYELKAPSGNAWCPATMSAHAFLHKGKLVFLRGNAMRCLEKHLEE